MSIMLEFRSPPGKPVLRGFDHYWSVIRTLDEKGSWSTHDVLSQSNVRERVTVDDFVRRLVAAGFAKETGETVRHRRQDAPTFRLLKAPRQTPCLRRDGSAGRQGRGQAQMWNVMRGPLARHGFTYRDLVLWGTTDEVAIAADSAKTYIDRLAKAGYLTCLEEGRPRHPGKWKLRPVMNTGPLAPAILRTSVVYDRNRAEAVGPCEAEEASP